MNNLLKWSIEASNPANPSSSESQTTAAARTLDPKDLQNLLSNAPSDAELMKAAMTVIRAKYTSDGNDANGGDDEGVTLENKLIAFDNFEQLVENLDNANNMEVLGLWTPLVEELGDEEAEMRRMAAWCVGTAVQNNEKAQERVCLKSFLALGYLERVFYDVVTDYALFQLLVFNGIPKLLELSLHDPETSVRRKAAYALSSAVRNYQPGLDELRKHLPDHIRGKDEKIDAGDMDRIDVIINKLKET